MIQPNTSQIGAVPTGRIGACYARFSSDSQKETSLDDQRRKCRERASQDGLIIGQDFEYCDEAVSGTTIDRRGLDELRSAATKRKFTDLYVDSLNRLSRECWFAFLLLKELVDVNRIRVVSVSEGIDSEHPGWFQLCVVLSLHHEQFLKDLSSNVKRGQEGTVLSGFSVGDVCYGYTSRVDPNGAMVGFGRNAKPRKIYSIVDEQAKWVIQIFRWYADDRRSIAWITRELNRLGVPKNPRSKHPRWYTSLVKGILRSEKYSGVWPWRSTRRVRNPVTGKARQERVPERERVKYKREFPNLQIVPSELFECAQQRLRQSRDEVARHRDSQGRICGSATRGKKRFFLDGLLICRACGKRLSVLDQDKTYYSCLRNCRGECEFSTRVPRRIAEELVLKVVSERLLRSEAWKEAVLQAAKSEWERLVRELPDERSALMKRRAELEAVVGRLISMVEAMESPAPSLAAQISQRERELQEISAALRQCSQTSTAETAPPTPESVAVGLEHLLDVTSDPTPAAIESFQRLFAGPIVVEDFSVSGRRRKLSAGTVKLSPIWVAHALSRRTPTEIELRDSEEIRLEFRRETVTEYQAQRALKLWNEGRYCEEIAKDLGVVASRVTAIFKFGHEVLGLPYPDTRRRRRAKSIYTRLETRVMDAWHEGQLCCEIAADHGVPRQTIRTIIIRWHEVRGLQMEDGRTRRKSLSTKARPYRPRESSNSADRATS